MRLPTIAAILLLFSLTMTKNVNAKNTASINFEISFTEPQAHYVDVQMAIDNMSANALTIKMPVWAPGSYLVREFSKNMESLRVTDSEGKPLTFVKTTKNSWKINSIHSKKVIVNYRVYAFEVSVRTSFVDADEAFLSSPDIFMYVDGQLDQPATVKIIPWKGWEKISTALIPVNNQNHTFYAANFDQLFDSPIEVGNQDIFYFNAAGVKHEVAMVKGGNYDTEKLKIDMAKIVEAETAIFGENPNKRYVFIIHNYAAGGGGLEHKSSTVLGAKRLGYTDEATYKDFLSLVAHEYFHLWNVKRLRPFALGPFNYDQENYTTNLWVAEGFTAYYENLICNRTNIFTEEYFLAELTKDINAIANQPGNKIQTLSESSFNAWIKYYRPNENSSNSSISYYNKGALVASVIDLSIIHNSEGKYSLDDAMKFAYNEYYKKLKRGYTDAEFRIVLEKFAGKSLKSIYDKYINGTADINFGTYLGYAGLKIVDSNEGNKIAYLGANTALINDKVVIRNVARNSAAYLSGLNVNDVILSMDGIKPDNVAKLIAEKKPNDILKFIVDRDGIEKTIDVQLKSNPNKNFVISEMDEKSDLQKKVFAKWLGQ
jgi:predicted metalloprotease with PDZ domain